MDLASAASFAAFVISGACVPASFIAARSAFRRVSALEKAVVDQPKALESGSSGDVAPVKAVLEVDAKIREFNELTSSSIMSISNRLKAIENASKPSTEFTSDDDLHWDNYVELTQALHRMSTYRLEELHATVNKVAEDRGIARRRRR